MLIIFLQTVNFIFLKQRAYFLMAYFIIYILMVLFFKGFFFFFNYFFTYFEFNKTRVDTLAINPSFIEFKKPVFSFFFGLDYFLNNYYFNY